MKKVADTLHLMRRKATWYYQRRVPAELNHIYGPVVKFSLDTTNKTDAKKLRSIHDLEWDVRFEKALQAINGNDAPLDTAKELSIDEIVNYLKQAVLSRDARAAKDFAADGGLSGNEMSELKIEAEIELDVLSNPENSLRSATTRAFLSKLLKDASPSTGSTITLEAEEYARRALVELCRRRLDRYSDRFDRPWHDSLFAPQNSPILFGQLAEEFVAATAEEQSVNGVGKKRRDKVSAFSRTMVEIVGEKFPVAELDDAKVHEVRSVLARLPSNRTKFYGDMPLAAVLKRANEESREPIGAITQSDYLRVFKAMTKFAVRRKYLAFDPAADVKPMKKASAAESARVPFSPEQLKGFFTSDFYRSCTKIAPEPYLGKDKDWRFWIPLLMLFSGARPNELAQLKISDVRTTEMGTPYLKLMPDTDNGMKLKTLSRIRRARLRQCNQFHPQNLSEKA